VYEHHDGLGGNTGIAQVRFLSLVLIFGSTRLWVYSLKASWNFCSP
jgi:hypothetical protein